MSENACDAVVQQDRPRHELLAEAKKRIFEDGTYGCWHRH